MPKRKLAYSPVSDDTIIDLEQEKFQTGWFGIPGGPAHRSLPVHVVRTGTRQPICGARVGPKQAFQWCASGIQFSYIECERCKKKVAKVREALRNAAQALARI